MQGVGVQGRPRTSFAPPAIRIHALGVERGALAVCRRPHIAWSAFLRGTIVF